MRQIVLYMLASLVGSILSLVLVFLAASSLVVVLRDAHEGRIPPSVTMHLAPDRFACH